MCLSSLTTVSSCSSHCYYAFLIALLFFYFLLALLWRQPHFQNLAALFLALSEKVLGSHFRGN